MKIWGGGLQPPKPPWCLHPCISLLMVLVLIYIAVVMRPVLSQSREVGHIACMRFLVTNSNSTHYYCLSWILGITLVIQGNTSETELSHMFMSLSSIYFHRRQAPSLINIGENTAFELQCWWLFQYTSIEVSFVHTFTQDHFFYCKEPAVILVNSKLLDLAIVASAM